jgi:hypothetical protein
LPDFLGTIYQHGGKCTKLPQNRPNVHKIYQNLPLQGPPKFAQIRILGLKKVPSGNPVSGARTFGSLEMNATKFFLAKKRSQKKVRKKSEKSQEQLPNVFASAIAQCKRNVLLHPTLQFGCRKKNCQIIILFNANLF